MTLTAMLKKGALRGAATATPATPATPATHDPYSLPTVATVAAVAVAKAEKAAANDPDNTAPKPDPAPDPDRYCWPHSAAMNGQEIDTFTARLTRFADKGLTLAQAEQAADQLVIRDREGDDRALCLECTHLQGAAGHWCCANPLAAAVARERLAPELVTMLQRCPGSRLPATGWGRADGQSNQGA